MSAFFEFYAASSTFMYFVTKEPMWMANFIADKRPDDELWKAPPELLLYSAPHNKKKGKKARLVPDIGYFVPGSIIINEKSYQVLGEYLSRFGELVDICIEGEHWYSYNLTNIKTDAVDLANSNCMAGGTVKIPAFFSDRLPSEPQIFKLPETKLLRMYCIGNGGESLKSLVENNGLTGLTFKPIA